MALWLKVDAKSGVPIYVQIVDQVRHAVEVGSLEPGDKLPTVRALAKEQTVAPNTIVKAYNELQRSGLIESRPGVGTVVASGVGDVAREQRVEALRERLVVLVRDAVGLGLTEDDIWEYFQVEFERVHSQANSG